MQRLRIRFRRGEEIKFISHLDIIRLWQRAFTRANIPLAYSEGFNPHPRISLAAPLALGITSDAELMDVYLSKELSPHFFTTTVNRQLPAGVSILQAIQVPSHIPTIQSQLRYAEYEVFLNETAPETTEAAISALLELETLPWQHQRDTGPHHYDLRQLIDDIWVIEHRPGGCRLGMRLRCDNTGSGRPEQVTAALGFTGYPQAVHRSRLVLKTYRDSN